MGNIGLSELVIVLIISALLALFNLFRAKDMPDLVRVLWVLIILGFPALGPTAFIVSRLVRASIEPDQNREQHA